VLKAKVDDVFHEYVVGQRFAEDRLQGLFVFLVSHEKHDQL
jgi:hypothetical protein